MAKPLRPDVQRDLPTISQCLAAECRRLCALGARLPLLSLAGSGRVWDNLCLSGTSSTDSDYEREEFRTENHHVDHLRVRVRDSRRRKFLGIVG